MIGALLPGTARRLHRSAPAMGSRFPPPALAMSWRWSLRRAAGHSMRAKSATPGRDLSRAKSGTGWRSRMRAPRLSSSLRIAECQTNLEFEWWARQGLNL
ncbi:hypothetical protein AAFN86_02130 [Roseomonas sp. CAU 1739]